MNVFEYAKKMELDGIRFYQEEAEKTSHPGFKRILLLLINREQKHYKFFDELQHKCNQGELLEFPMEDAENIFRQLRQNKEGFNFSEAEVEVYRKALEIEKRSEKFCLFDGFCRKS